MEASLPMATVPVGEYISVWKSIPLIIVILIWARLLTWADKDAVAARLPRVPLNIGLFLGGLIGFVLFFWLPNFWLALAVLIFVLLLEATVFLVMRHRAVGLGDLKTQFIDWFNGIFRKERVVKAMPGMVMLSTRNGHMIAPPEVESPERSAYETVQSLLTEPLKKDAERVDFMPSDGVWEMQYFVDGVGYSGGQTDREGSAAAITYLKQAAGLSVDEKRKPQLGHLNAAVDGNRKDLQVQTAGSASGEQLRILVDPQKRHQLKLDDLGWSSRQLDMLQKSISENKGIVLLSAPKDQGLTTLLYAVIRAHDAFMTHIITIERAPDQDLEGITQNKLPVNATPAEEAKQTTWVVSQAPDVMLMNSIQSPESAEQLIQLAGTGKRIYVGLRAINTFDALAQWRKLVGNDKSAMKDLDMIINGRIIRKLCNACKAGYAPDPSMLRKLNIDPTEVTKLYQARTEPLRDQKGNPIACNFCHDLHYKGRRGVYEMFVVNDEVRQAVASGAEANQLKALFRKQKGRYLQEQALSAVKRGETSVQEMLRVLRGGENRPSSSEQAAPKAKSPDPASKPPVKPSA